MFLDRTKDKLRDWFRRNADTAKGRAWLFVFAFTEASFFLIPPDIFLIAILVVAPARWLFYSLFTTFASTLGGLFGYVIGFYLFDLIGQPIIDAYGLSGEMLKVGLWFEEYGALVVFISAFTPIPYKVFTIAAGFFSFSLIQFLLASLVGRGARYLLVGYIMRHYGERAGKLVYKYFNYIVLLLAVVVFALIIIYGV